MRLMILGSHSDDKGTQLEKLTRDIFISLGFTNIELNKEGGYGEIDVSGQFIVPGMGHTTTHHLVGECKARSDPVNTTDWMKFYGKVHAHKATVTPNTVGYLVALTGANGKVVSSFEGIKKTDPNIHLVTSEYLIKYLTETQGLVPELALRAAVKKLTDRVLVDVSLTYYASKAYWILDYGDGSFTLLMPNGDAVAPETATKLQPMLAEQMNALVHINLNDEQKARQLHEASRKAVLAAAIAGNGKANLADGLSIWKWEPLTELSVEKAAKELVEAGYITMSGSTYEMSPALDQDVSKLADLMIALLNGDTVYSAITSSWYTSRLNDKLLGEACRRQREISLSPKERSDAVKLMQLSPMAVLQALHPHPLIVNHRGALPDPKFNVAGVPHIDEGDARFFMNMLYQSLAVDFQNPGLHKYMYEFHRIERFSIVHQTKVISREGQEMVAAEIPMGYRIGQWHQDAPDGSPIYVPMLAFDDDLAADSSQGDQGTPP
jgi:hypothetical protein